MYTEMGLWNIMNGCSQDKLIWKYVLNCLKTLELLKRHSIGAC